jgi:glutamate transport system substrate-binding protein
MRSSGSGATSRNHSGLRNLLTAFRLLCAGAAVGLIAACSASPTRQPPSSAVAPVPTVADGSTLQSIRQRGTVRIGVKFDVPLFGFRDTAGRLDGFDIRIAEMVAADIFDQSDARDRIEFVEALSKDREAFLQAGTVDLVVSTYTITESRKQFVDFAGPYYIAGQDILARTEDVNSGRISGVGSLNGLKVCAVTGSTSLTNLIAAAPDADTSVTAERYPECFEALRSGKVDAMTTDDVILLGLRQTDPSAFALTGNPFHTEPYGVGIPKGDSQLRALVNATLGRSFTNGTWARAFSSTVGTVGADTPAPPQLSP